MDKCISAFKRFCYLQFCWSYLAETELCEDFGLDTGQYTIPHVTNVFHFELRFLVASFTEIEQHLRKVQWFVRVNAQGLTAIFSKLRQYGEADTSSFRQSETHWQGVEQELRAQLFHRLDWVARLQLDTCSALSFPEQPTRESLYLHRALRQSPCPGVSIDGLQQALRDSGPIGVSRMLMAANPTPGITGENLGSLLHDTFMLSFLHSPHQLAMSLELYLSLTGKRTIDARGLSWSIAVAGRAQSQALDTASGPCQQPPYLGSAVQALSTICRNLVGNAPNKSSTFVSPDWFDRRPLHHAARYGLTATCEEILEGCNRSGSPAVAIMALSKVDGEGMTPLHLAVAGNHTSTAKCLIRAIPDNLTAEEDTVIKSTMGDVLHLALENQSDDVVTLLLRQDANLHRRSSRGETVLHIAARLGRTDYTSLLLEAMSNQGAEIDTPDASRGWTPLFFACAAGHFDVAKLLLDAGLCQQRTDLLGWTAKECAIFKGHLAIGDLFNAFETGKPVEGPARLPVRGTVYPDLRCREGEAIIIATLGSTRSDKPVTAVDLGYCSSEYNPGACQDTSFVLEVSALGTGDVPRRLQLPILDENINDPFVFNVSGVAKPQLKFDISRSTAARDIVGSGTAILHSNSHQFGAKRQSLIREQTAVILNRDKMSIAGTVTFTYLVAKPFPHLQTPQLVGLDRKASQPPLLVGHRGLGQNVLDHTYLQLGENTIESFLSAAKLGAGFVEFDVQVTRDLQAVVYHDFSLSESGTDIPIHDLTLDQYMYAGDIQSPRGNPLSMLGKAQSHTLSGRQRSRSLGGQFETGAIQIQDRMKHTVDFVQKGFKPNTRGVSVQDSFATLKEILIQLPPGIGCDIEISSLLFS